MSRPATLLASASAPGKIILAGEHAVVYGHPAIAVPVWQVAARATVHSAPSGSGLTILLPDIGVSLALPPATFQDDERAADEHPPNEHPVTRLARMALHEASVDSCPDWQITITSTIPIAGGLGSGAALSTALVRAIFEAAQRPAPPEAVSALVYQAEMTYHGTPSGIDNTVIAYGRALWFVRGESPLFLTIGGQQTLLIADSGIRSPTAETVADVRRARAADPDRYDRLFLEIGTLVRSLRPALKAGDGAQLGALFNANQQLLAAIGVSSSPLERIIAAARNAGALGAKLSGGGRGGNVIALATPETAPAVEQAMAQAGAVRIIRTILRDQGLQDGQAPEQAYRHP